MSQHDPWPHVPDDENLSGLVREALQDTVGIGEPPARVWARIRAEVEADRVPIWVAWWQRLWLMFADRLPRTMQNAVVLTLVLLLASLSFSRLGWLESRMPVAGTGTLSDQRQIVLAEQRFREQYYVARSVFPKDIPPKGERRTPPVPAKPTDPQHLAVGA